MFCREELMGQLSVIKEQRIEEWKVMSSYQVQEWSVLRQWTACFRKVIIEQ